jgi:hypothetical protein
MGDEVTNRRKRHQHRRNRLRRKRLEAVWQGLNEMRK